MSQPHRCLLLAILALPLMATGQSAGPRAVNPLTGTPLSLEDMHWTLEQARLEEQLQASLLNRRKFELERQRLELGGLDMPADGRSAMPGSGRAAILGAPGSSALAWPGPAAGVSSAPATSGAPLAAAAHPRRLRATSAPVRSSDWSVVGVRAQGTAWCLLVAEEGRLWPLCAGDWRRGHHVDAVSEQAYTVDGVPHPLEIPVARLHMPTAIPESVPESRDLAEPGPPAGGPAIVDDPLLAVEGATDGMPASASGLRLAKPQPVLQR